MNNRLLFPQLLSLIFCAAITLLQTQPALADTQAFTLTKSGFVCEAEDCMLSGTYATANDSSASGGQYVVSTDKAWTTSVSSDETGELELYLESDAVVRYALWVRCKIGNSEGSKSIFWGWNTSNYTGAWFSACDEWKWQKVGFVTMVPGTNKIKICKRAPGAMLDKIMLCESRYTPSGDGVLPTTPSDYEVTNPYNMPPVTPPEQTHPRVLVNDARMSEIKQTAALLDSLLPENAEFYEAEQQIHIDGFSHIGQDSEAYNGEYLMGYDNCQTVQADEDGELSFSYTAKSTADHAVWIRCKVPDKSSDTLFYRVSGGAWKTAMFKVSTKYIWQKVGVVKLAEGENTIQFHHREPNLRIDRILVTSDTELYQFDEAANIDGYPSIEPIYSAYQQMLAYKNSHRKAIYTLPTDWDVRNYDEGDLSVIQAKAFFALIKNDNQSGESAYEMLQNFILTAHFLRDIHSIRNIGDTVFTGALVYDWCYSILTSDERDELRTNLLNLQAMMETGYPPATKNSISGHMGENEVLRDSLSLGIAVYDEDSSLYNMAAGGIFQNMVDWYKYMYNGGFHSQGTAYGIHIRYKAELMATALFNAIGYENVFGDNQKNIAYESIYAARPDGQLFRDGDVYYSAWQDETPLFLAAHIYRDSNINVKFSNINQKYGNHVPYLYYMTLGDISLPIGDTDSLPLTRFYGSPAGAMIARTGWQDGKTSNDAMAFFKIGEEYFGGHQHMDSGQFQIYYKGGLATSGGIYSSYGDAHHTNYYTRTIAHNSMLAYDPNEKFSGITANDGGQKALNKYIDSLDTMLDDDYSKCGEVLAHGFGPDPKRPYYSYLKGNMTSAYSSKMENFERSFVFLNFEDEDYPAAVIVLDKVETSKPEIKKTWIMHSVEEPEVDGITTVVKRTQYDYSGKLINTTLWPKADNVNINVVGGAGQEFLVDGVNYAADFSESELEEGAGYRIEISPAEESETDCFLNVMQVMDNDDSLNGQQVTGFEDDNFLGAYIGNSLTLFSKGETVNNSFSLNITEGTKTVIFGVADGIWSVMSENGNVTYCSAFDEDNAVMFVPGESGTYTFTLEGDWIRNITDEFVTNSFGFYNESGTKIGNLSEASGSSVELRSSIRRLGVKMDKATLIGAVYKNGIIYDMAVEEGVYSGIGAEYEYKLKLNVPLDVTNCEIKVFMFDDLENLRPITHCTSMQASNANIKSLYINGKKIDAFNSSKTELVLDITTAQLGENPEILAVCEDLGAYAAYTYAKGALTLTAIAPNGASKVYNITVPIASSEPTILYSALNYDYTNSTGTKRVNDSSYFTIQSRKLARPDYAKDADGNVLYEPSSSDSTKYVVKSTYEDLNNGKANFILNGDGTKYVLFADVPPQLEGATVLQGKRLYNASNNATYDYSDMSATLTLNHSARLYYPASKVLNGGKLSTDAGYLRIVELGNKSERISQIDTLTSSKIDDNDKWYEIDLVVPEGEIKTFTVDVCGATANAFGWQQFGPALLLKWIDKGTVSNPTLTYTQASGGETKTVNYTVKTRPLSNPNYNRTAAAIDDSTDKKETVAAFSNWNDIAAKATTVYAESGIYSYVSAVPEELKDGILLCPGRVSNIKEDYADMTATFTVNKSAKLYYRATASVAAKTSGATLSYDTDGLKIKQNQYGGVLAADTNVPGAAAWFNDGYSEKWYEVDLNTPEGTEKTFSIPVGGINSQWGGTHYGPVMIIKWQDYEETD